MNPSMMLSNHLMKYTAFAILYILVLPIHIEGSFPCKANEKTVIPLTPNVYPSREDIGPPYANRSNLVNMTCIWNITAPPSHALVIDIMMYIRSNDSSACSKSETLQLFDGPNESSKSLFHSCSRIQKPAFLTEKFFTSGGHGLIKLTTPSNFLMNSTATLFLRISVGAVKICPLGVVTSLTASTNTSTLTSSSYYGDNYPKNVSCAWRITAPSNQIVILRIEASVQCHINDRLEIYDSEREDPENRLGKICSTSKQTLFSTGHVVYVMFSSNGTYQPSIGTRARSFTIHYSATLPVCPFGVVTNLTASTNSSKITPSSHYGDNYPKNISCAWRISAPSNQIIKLQIEASVQCYINDRLEIYDSEREDPDDRLGKICYTSKQTLFSIGHVVYVVFSSNSTYQPTTGTRSFTIHYSAMLPGTTCSPSNTAEQNQNIVIREPSSGVIASLDFPNKFPPNLDCRWKFLSLPGQVIKMYFDTVNINVEPKSSCLYKPYLRVFDGFQDGVSPLLRSLICQYAFSDSVKPSFFVLSSGRKLAVHFLSETSGTVSGYGFKANYTFESLDVSGTCGEGRTGMINLQGQGASFSSPGYEFHNKQHPKNMTCLWNITSDAGFIILIRTISNDLTMGCESEFVKVYDGATLDSPVLGTMCRGKTPYYLYSSRNSVLVEMKTSSSDQRGKGFHMSYRAVMYERNDYVCSSANRVIKIEKPSAKVVSPWYPVGYPNNVYCIWGFTSPFGTYARVNITNLHLQDSKDCKADYVKVYGGIYLTSPLHRTICGKATTPISIVSSERKLMIRMESDWIGQYPGFEAHFDSFEDVSFGDCKVQGQDNHLPLNSSSGVFFSPRYPKGIPSNMMCTWVITAKEGSFIRLEFIGFDLDFTCKKKSELVIRDGPSQASKSLGTYCGYKKPPSIFSSGRQLWVRFTSKDRSAVDKGFNATYTTVTALPSSFSCREQSLKKFDSSSGQFASHDYPLEYGNNVLCQWTIRVSDGKRVKLTFDSFNIQKTPGCSGDFVEVFDGLSKYSESLGKFCGDEKPEPVHSSGAHMHIRFQTDNTGQYPGFKASYESVLSVRSIILIVVFTLLGVGALLSLIGWCCKSNVYKHNPEPAPPDGAASTAGSNIELTAKL